VLRIVGAAAGSKSETLHECCAGHWFAGLRNFDADDDDRADRTCAQCGGEIDGTEGLVSVGGRAVWLHPVCERFWLRAHEAGER
jgi:hypothetical protein